MASPSLAITGSMSVTDITKMAQEYDYSPRVSFQRWVRTAWTLQKQADIYDFEGHLAQAYMLLFRHGDLVLDKLTAHPEARLPGNIRQLRALEKEVGINIRRMEGLKPRIEEQHDRFVQWVREREARRAAIKASRHVEPPDPSSAGSQTPPDPVLSNGTQAIEAREHAQLAVKLGQREINRRATARKATRQAGVSPSEERRRRSGGMWGDWESKFSQDISSSEVDDMSRHLQAARSQMEPRQRTSGLKQTSPARSKAASSVTYHYPTVPSVSQQRDWNLSAPVPLSPPRSSLESELRRGPALPPKEELYPNGNHYDIREVQPPPRPEKVTILTPSESQSTTLSTPTPDESESPQKASYTFKPSAYLENGTPLRTIILPSQLRHEFLKIAHHNTQRNLETCGILCGTLVCNALFISKLVIPDQESTSDTCEMVNEHALLDYCDSEDLMTLGWIHTHPTQTCFMSSRDLHTHYPYQVLMPESIAVVCAPSKENDWGVFRLTDPPGMKTIANCHQSGVFHPHAENNIYTEAVRPGHVLVVEGMNFGVVDLRGK